MRWRAYDLDHQYSRKRRVAAMRAAEDGAVSAVITPDYSTWGDPRTSAEQQRASRDPLSSLIAMAIDVGRSRRCEGSYPTFDGRFHYRLDLSRGEIDDFEGGGFEGQVLKCRMDYVAVAGFERRDRAAAAPYGEVWFALAPIPTSPRRCGSPRPLRWRRDHSAHAMAARHCQRGNRRRSAQDADLNRNSPKTSARIAAAQLLVAVLERGRALEDAFGVPAYAALEGRDRAFARAMATAALRRLGGLDNILQRFLQKPIAETSDEARACCASARRKMLVLDTPAHAAVGETVDAAHALAAVSKLINAVLRKVSGAEGGVQRTGRRASICRPGCSHAWRAAYRDQADDIANALSMEAPLDLTVKDNPQQWAETLIGDVTPTGSVRLAPGHGPIDQLPGFAEGAGGCKTPPPLCPRVCSAMSPARPCSTSAPRPAARQCTSPRGALSPPPTTTKRALSCLKQNLVRQAGRHVGCARRADAQKPKRTSTPCCSTLPAPPPRCAATPTSHGCAGPMT